jgi:hypothetical protein
VEEKELIIPHHLKKREEVERKEAQTISASGKTHHKKRPSNQALTVTKHLYFT